MIFILQYNSFVTQMDIQVVNVQ